LRVVSGDTGKVWDGFLVTILDEVLVDGSVNDGLDLGLNSADNGWEDCRFEKWDEDGSNLGNEGSSKLNINIIWVNSDIRFLYLKFWGHFGRWGSWLFRNINFHINSHFLDVNISGTSDGNPVGIGEVSRKFGSNLVSYELSTVASMV
jgi:hypothetical protein